MPRTGKHPLKLANTAATRRKTHLITVCTVTHIPMMAGYWANSLKVLEQFFESLYSSTDMSFDLMVFDNASCLDVQDYLLLLQRVGKIQTLTLSTHNLKKLGAMDFLFANAPGEFVAFVDSDVYLLPGWLEESIAVLRTFPEAGQVTALPTIDKRAKYVQSTLRGLETAQDVTIERGNLVPAACIESHRLSIGRERVDYLANAGPGEDIRITRKEVSAYVSAQDFQFTTRREIIRQVLPLEVRNPGEYYDPIYSPVFEAKIDEYGWWRLSTTHYLAHHMGNCLPNLTDELAGLNAGIASSAQPALSSETASITSWRGHILKSRPVRGLLKRLYTCAYTLLFEQL